jgi:hypothetical protein
MVSEKDSFMDWDKKIVTQELLLYIRERLVAALETKHKDDPRFGQVLCAGNFLIDPIWQHQSYSMIAGLLETMEHDVNHATMGVWFKCDPSLYSPEKIAEIYNARTSQKRKNLSYDKKLVSLDLLLFMREQLVPALEYNPTNNKILGNFCNFTHFLLDKIWQPQKYSSVGVILELMLREANNVLKGFQYKCDPSIYSVDRIKAIYGE